MSISTRIGLVICAVSAVLLASTVDSSAGGRDALGFRAGMSAGPDQFVLGGQGEWGPVLDATYMVPSLDFGFQDPNTAIANFDFRWYLARLPETGIRFYGAAGPTLVMSPSTELGVSLTVGMHIPMKAQRRYNVEMRFGLGDIPDVKILGALMFGI